MIPTDNKHLSKLIFDISGNFPVEGKKLGVQEFHSPKPHFSSQQAHPSLGGLPLKVCEILTTPSISDKLQT